MEEEKEVIQEEKTEVVTEVKKESKENGKSNGLATAALIVSIIALVLSLIPIIRYVSYILGPIGLILGVVALSKKQKKEMTIAAIVLAVIAILIVVIAQIRFNRNLNLVNNALSDLSESLNDSFSNKTEDVLANELDVELGDFIVIEDEWFSDTEMKVTLKNKSNQQKTFSVQIEAMDADGNRIDEDTVYASNLGVGQTVEQKAFSFVLEEKIPDMEAATFRIIEATSY